MCMLHIIVGRQKSICGIRGSSRRRTGSEECRASLERGGCRCSSGWAGEENKISIRIHHDEGSGAPGFLLQRLVKADSGGLVAQEELLDLIRGCDGERSGEQVSTLPNFANEHRFADHPQIK